jgi:hypothetical protein
MNARFTSESDIRGYGSNVCFGPEADIHYSPMDSALLGETIAP